MVAQTLKKNLKNDTDFLGRYGGEEFLIITDNMDKRETFEFSETLRRSVEKLNIPHKRSDLGHITISLGATICVADKHAYTVEEVIESADQLLYKAKLTGRNTVAM